MSSPKKDPNHEKLAGGFLRSHNANHVAGEAVRVENVRPDEMCQAEGHPRPWTKMPRVRKTKLAVMGIGKDLLNQGDPRYKRALILANTYRKVRAKELAVMHGYVSSGASALLASGSLALAASRFLYEKAAEISDVIEQGKMLKQASALSDSARQSELAAWELSAREGVIKRKHDLSTVSAPWLAQDGTEQKRPGRKTNAERERLLNEAPVLTSQRGLTIDEVLTTSLEGDDDGEGRKRLEGDGS